MMKNPTNSLCSVLLIAGAVSCAVASCGTLEKAARSGQNQPCPTISHREGGVAADKRHSLPNFGASDSPWLKGSAEGVLYAERVDLNCDGDPDFVGQVLERSEAGGELVFVAMLREDNVWRTVLQSPSDVTGRETLVIAADMDGDGWLELVTWGSDEGGYVPRVFRSRRGEYQAVPLSPAYTLRFEERWTEVCRLAASIAPCLRTLWTSGRR
jgi:hypothetical protein